MDTPSLSPAAAEPPAGLDPDACEVEGMGNWLAACAHCGAMNRRPRENGAFRCHRCNSANPPGMALL